MSAATISLNTETRGPLSEVVLQVKASADIFNGTLVSVLTGGSDAGYAMAAANAAYHKVVGISFGAPSGADTVYGDEVEGGASNGDVSVVVKSGSVKLNNSGSNPVTQAYIGRVCYVEDDNTVSISAGTYGVIAGVVEQIDDDDGVWVKVDGTLPVFPPVQVTLNSANGEIAGLTISAAYSQAEIQALQTKAEDLLDDVRAIHAALVTHNLIRA